MKMCRGLILSVILSEPNCFVSYGELVDRKLISNTGKRHAVWVWNQWISCLPWTCVVTGTHSLIFMNLASSSRSQLSFCCRSSYSLLTMGPTHCAAQGRLASVKALVKRLRIVVILKYKNVWAAELIAEMLPESHLRFWSKRTWETNVQKVRELLRNVKELVGWHVVCHMALTSLSLHKIQGENKWLTTAALRQSNLFKLVLHIIDRSKLHMIDWLLI